MRPKNLPYFYVLNSETKKRMSRWTHLKKPKAWQAQLFKLFRLKVNSHLFKLCASVAIDLGLNIICEYISEHSSLRLSANTHISINKIFGMLYWKSYFLIDLLLFESNNLPLGYKSTHRMYNSFAAFLMIQLLNTSDQASKKLHIGCIAGFLRWTQ